MRIIHTSDWHLGQELHEYSRGFEHDAFIDWLVGQICNRQADHKSYTEQYIDSLGLFSEAIVGVIGAIAEQERVRISERTKAGMARVRATGKHIGRPRRECDIVRANRMRERGMTYTTIAARLGLSRSVVWKRLNAL